MLKRFSASRLTRVFYDRSIDVLNPFSLSIFFLAPDRKVGRTKTKKHRSRLSTAASSLLNILCTVVALLHNNEVNGKFFVCIATLVAVDEPI